MTSVQLPPLAGSTGSAVLLACAGAPPIKPALINIVTHSIIIMPDCIQSRVAISTSDTLLLRRRRING
jgi:hypothetical protein